MALVTQLIPADFSGNLKGYAVLKVLSDKIYDFDDINLMLAAKGIRASVCLFDRFCQKEKIRYELAVVPENHVPVSDWDSVTNSLVSNIHQVL